MFVYLNNIFAMQTQTHKNMQLCTYRSI